MGGVLWEMRHDTLRYPVSFSVFMGPTSQYLCLQDGGAAPEHRLTSQHSGGEKRDTNLSPSSPLPCGEESLESKSTKE